MGGRTLPPLPQGQRRGAQRAPRWGTSHRSGKDNRARPVHWSRQYGLGQIKVNGRVEPLPRGAESIQFMGESSLDAPLRWE